MNSMTSLMWVLLLLFVIMFLFACVLTQAVTNAFLSDDMPIAITLEDKDNLRNSYGDLFSTMYSLFQAITGGNDWSAFADPLFKISSGLGLLFTAYIAFTIFAVLNVVTAVFVDNAMESRKTDMDLQIVQEIQAREKIQEALTAVFTAADTDVSGTISWEEFKEHFSHPAVEAYFRQLGLDINRVGVEGLWELIDLDGNGQLQIVELAAGADSLKGHASSLDLARVSHYQLTHTKQIMSLTEQAWQTQSRQVNALQRDVQKLVSRLQKPFPSTG